MEFDKEILIKRFDYHFNLNSRHWQYFAAFILLNGFLLNAWEKAFKYSTLFASLYCSVSIWSAIVFLRLISRTRKRIQINTHEINMIVGKKFFGVPEKSEFHFSGITIWLYSAIIAMSSVWLYLLFGINPFLFAIMLLAFLINLFFLNWKSYPNPDPLSFEKMAD